MDTDVDKILKEAAGDFELGILYVMLVRNGFKVTNVVIHKLSEIYCSIKFEIEYYGEDGGQEVFDRKVNLLTYLVKFRKYILIQGDVKDMVKENE